MTVSLGQEPAFEAPLCSKLGFIAGLFSDSLLRSTRLMGAGHPRVPVRVAAGATMTVDARFEEVRACPFARTDSRFHRFAVTTSVRTPFFIR